MDERSSQSRFPPDILVDVFVEWDREERELVVVAGVANDNERTTVPRPPSWCAPPPFALAVLPQEVMGIAVPGEPIFGVLLRSLGEVRVGCVLGRCALALVFGDTMVAVFFGWLVLRFGG
jgi:hypothetical protein